MRRKHWSVWWEKTCCMSDAEQDLWTFQVAFLDLLVTGEKLDCFHAVKLGTWLSQKPRCQIILPKHGRVHPTKSTCPSLDGLDGLRIVHTGCVRKKHHVNLRIQKANSALMGSVFHPTLKNGRNLWRAPWAALRTKCTEAPLPQGLTAHKISGICLRNLLGQVFHPHPLEAVSILVHQLRNHNANNCQRLHLSDWSATCFDTWPQSWQRWQLQSLLGYCDVSCINPGGIKMYLGWPVRSICGKVNLFLIYTGLMCRDSTSRKNDIIYSVKWWIFTDILFHKDVPKSIPPLWFRLPNPKQEKCSRCILAPRVSQY